MAEAEERAFAQDTCLALPGDVPGNKKRSYTSPPPRPAANRSANLRDPQGAPELALDLRVVLGGTQISLADARRLKTGSVLLLDHGVTEPVDVLANQTLVARGDLFVLDGRYCIRINEKIQGPPAS